MRPRVLAPLSALLAAACAHAPAPTPAASAAAAAPPVASASNAGPAAPAGNAASPGDEWFLSVAGGAGDLRVSVGGAGGTPVLFVHGLGADMEVWRAQLDHLRALGVRAIAYDQRGHGASDRPSDGVYTIDALVDDLDRVVTALSLERFVLVGHSMSGAVISAYAGAHPDAVAGLVYVDAVGSFDTLPPGAVRDFIAADADRDAAGVRTAFVEMLGNAREETRRRVLASVASLEPRAFISLRRSMIEAPSREAFARYHGPTVAIETGAVAPPFAASAALGVRRVLVPDVSHWLMLDAPAATSAALDAFLAAVPR
jgi:pimeloyl-ACP methyl ester carboxylesterase